MTDVFDLPTGSVAPHDWLCKRCRLYITDKVTLNNVLQSDTSCPDDIIRKRAEILKSAADRVKQHGIVFTKDLISKFKNYLSQYQNISQDGEVKLVRAFVYYQCTSLTHCSFSIYSPKSRKNGIAYYDSSVFSEQSLCLSNI